MKKLLFIALLAVIGLQANAQEAKSFEELSISKALFKQGDDASWANPDMDDSSWSNIDVTKYWNEQGFPLNNNACAWYRIHVNIPKSYFSAHQNEPRRAESVGAIRVYNRGGSGGLHSNPLNIFCPKAADGLSMRLTDTNVGNYHYDVEINNEYATSTSGKLQITITDRETGAVVKSISKKIIVKRNKPVNVTVPYSMDKMYHLSAIYTDDNTGKVLIENKICSLGVTSPKWTTLP